MYSRNRTGLIRSLGYVLICALPHLSTGALAANDAFGTAADAQVLSQRITKNYLYVAQDLLAGKASSQLQEAFDQLDLAITNIEGQLTDPDSGPQLALMTYSRDELRALSALPYSIENGSLMLDLSESLLEAAEGMVRQLQGEGRSEQMIALIERERLLVERIAKYYIAFRAGFNDFNTVKQLKESVTDFAAGLTTVSAFQGYPPELKEKVGKINKLWEVVYKYYMDVEKNELPSVVFISVDRLAELLGELSAFHRQ